MAFIFTNTNITTIDTRAFENVGVYDVYFDDSNIEVIGSSTGTSASTYTFNSPNLRKVSFKNASKLQYIYMSAFSRNTNLTSIDFTGCTELTTISSFAFTANGLIDVDLTPCIALRSMGSGVFAANNFLKTFNASGLINLTTIADGNTTELNGFLRACPLLESIDFSGCSSLIKIPNYMCESKDVMLTSVNISGCTSLTTIGQNAFNGCTSLATVDMTSCTSLTTIGQSAFNNCKVLPTITDWENVKQTVQTFNTSAFNGCTALNMDLSHMPVVATFGQTAFQNCTSLTTTLEECPNLVTIGQSAFQGCTSLGDIDLHNNTSLTTIGNSAFQSAKAVHVNLNNCSALTSIGQKAWYGSQTEVFTMDDCNSLTSLPTATSSDIGAWQSCNKLREFSAQRCALLTTTGTKSFQGDNALETCSFKGCPVLASIKNSCFANIKPTTGICVFDFTDCPSLTLIDNYAFSTSKFDKLLLKGSIIQSINLRAFESTNFKQVTIHDVTDDTETSLLDFSGSTYLTTIGDNAFLSSTGAFCVDLSNCPSLTTIGEGAFYKISNGKYLKMDGTENLEIINTYAFRCFGSKGTTPTANIKAPKLTTLGNLAFGDENNASCLVIATFDASGAPLQSIGSRAFCRAINLTNVSFANCQNLEKTANGGDATFYQCSKLETADFTGCTSLKQVDKDTFFECTKVNILGVEDWPVETIGQAAFNMCQVQPTLKFTNSTLTTVNNQAFRGCNGCSEIELHMAQTSEDAIYHQAFTGCGSNVGGCNIKIYTGDTLPNVTPIGNDQTTGNADATWRISFGTNSGTTFHFPTVAETSAKATAKLLEDDTKSKRDGTGTSATTVTGNIAWWCCSNGQLSTTTGGSDGAQEAHVNLWYTGSPTLAFDL